MLSVYIDSTTHASSLWVHLNHSYSNQHDFTLLLLWETKLPGILFHLKFLITVWKVLVKVKGSNIRSINRKCNPLLAISYLRYPVVNLSVGHKETVKKRVRKKCHGIKKLINGQSHVPSTLVNDQSFPHSVLVQYKNSKLKVFERGCKQDWLNGVALKRDHCLTS